MFEIIANKTNSLDVDKLDYLERDAKHLGLQCMSFATDRVIKSARVINNKLCFNQKNYYDIEQVFQTRYKLFKECYSHRVCKAIDFMIVDALIAANQVYHFEETIRDPSRYVDMTDNVLCNIENSHNPNLRESQNILKRVRRRDLYRFIASKLITNKDVIRKHVI